ncbi:MAG: MATE family efflux transporter [Polyangiales bacterium]
MTSEPPDSAVDIVASELCEPEPSSELSPPQPRPRTTARTIVSLTWPVVLGQFMANAVPIFDLIMLRRYGTPTLAAIGYASQFLMLTQATLMAIGAAGVAMMARAIGARDLLRARRAFAANLWLALGVTGTTLLVTLVFPEQLLRMLAVNDAVTHLAVPYLRLTLTAAPLMAIALTYESAFRAARDTFRPMLVVCLVALVKFGCNLLLLTGVWGLPKLGLQGAGISTLVSQFVGASLFIAVSRMHHHSAVRLGLRDMLIPRELLREAFDLAWPAVAERFTMNAATLIYFRFLGGYGLEAIAAYNIGVRILAFTWIPGLGLSVAAATLVGQALGAGDPAAARRAGTVASRIGALIALTLALMFIALRAPLARAFTEDPTVIKALEPFILLLGVGLPFLVAHFTLAGALRGAGDTLTPLWAAAVGNWVFRVPLGYLCAQILGLDLFWVWSIMIVDHFSRALWLQHAFKHGRWHERVGVTTRSKRSEQRVATAT